jgi:hypothetical protein
MNVAGESHRCAAEVLGEPGHQLSLGPPLISAELFGQLG